MFKVFEDLETFYKKFPGLNSLKLYLNHKKWNFQGDY